MSTPLDGDPREMAVNLLEQRLRRHHPVMLAVPLRAYALEWEIITELNGLRVPAHYDCNNFNNGRSWMHNHDYFSSVPSRWLACELHEAHVKSGLSVVVPERPLFDEEYIEFVSVLQSVMRAPRGATFVMAEIGARWGPWGARAAAFARANRPDLHPRLHFVEPTPDACRAIHSVAKINGLTSTVQCGRASSADFVQWADKQPHIDLVDIDIQGYEQEFVPNVAQVLSDKAYRVIIGTHGVMGNEMGFPRNLSRAIQKMHYCHEVVRKTFASWLLVNEVEVQGYYRCIFRYMRGNHLFPDSRFDWKSMLDKKCYHTTPFGPIAAWDGEFVFDNPRFVDPVKAFSLSDTELKVDDLRQHVHLGASETVTTRVRRSSELSTVLSTHLSKAPTPTQWEDA